MIHTSGFGVREAQQVCLVSMPCLVLLFVKSRQHAALGGYNFDAAVR